MSRFGEVSRNCSELASSAWGVFSLARVAICVTNYSGILRIESVFLGVCYLLLPLLLLLFPNPGGHRACEGRRRDGQGCHDGVGKNNQGKKVKQGEREASSQHGIRNLSSVLCRQAFCRAPTSLATVPRCIPFRHKLIEPRKVLLLRLNFLRQGDDRGRGRLDRPMSVRVWRQQVNRGMVLSLNPRNNNNSSNSSNASVDSTPPLRQ